jgi:deoxyribodipyrimidine photo-lyase
MIDLVWFKRDLRVHDHAPLTAAVASGRPVLALYIAEPELWAQPEMAGRHYAFLNESLGDLAGALAARGGQLVRRVGDAVAILADLHTRYGLAAVHSHQETGLLWTYARDKAVRRWARTAGVPLFEYRQHGVWRALHQRDGWAKRWDAMMAAPSLPAPKHIRAAPLASDAWPDAAGLGLVADPCPQRQRGGRQEAIALLRSFLQERGRPYQRAMSSPLAGAQACSRISAHLAYGCLSMRETSQAAQRALVRHRQDGDTSFAASLRSFIARLHWHCHFIQKLEDEPDIEQRDLHPAYRGLRQTDEALVAAWATGQTGFPFIDACMRSLRATGWLNFRMRAMVMAFAAYHLWQDWRRPAQELAKLFTDFEPGIHYPQAQMQAGSTGVNTARIYNPVKQSHDQDPDGAFIRMWVPEVAHLPTPLLHEPWTAGADLAYPPPLVDHVSAARTAREQIYAVRRGSSYRRAAESIQAKHGSRKSGLAAAGQRRKTRPVNQGEFEF